MKKVLSLLMAAVLLLLMTGNVFAASALELTYHIKCDKYEYVTPNSAENYRIEVPQGSVLTIDFLIEADDVFTLSSFQNEVCFDPDFFTFMTDSGKAEKEGTRCALKEYSDGEERVFINTVTDTAMTKNQKVASFSLYVAEDTVGAESVIETALPKANDADGEISVINEKNLEVVIIAGDPNLKKHSITYKDGDEVLKSFEVIKGEEISLEENNTEKSNVVFDGWRVNGTIKKPGDRISVDADTTIEAVWKAKEEFLLHFDTNGGSSVPSVKGYKGDTINLTQTSSKSGYTLDGWYSDSALTTKVTSIVLNADTTVYAKWSVEYTGGGSGGGGGGGGSAPKNTLTFMTPDGVVLDEVKKAENSTVSLSMHRFDKVGYVFEGWYTDKALTNKVTSIKMDKDITLYANWKTDAQAMLENRPKILATEHFAYIVGREGGYICPQDNITRAEVATIFYRLLEESVRNENKAAENAFSDVNENDWFNTAVSTLSSMQVVNGRAADSFAPNAFITRAEFTTIAARLSEASYDGESLFSDIAGHWAEDYINTAASIGWVVGDSNKFRPDDFITRAEAMTLVNRVLCRVPKSKDDLHADMKKWIDNADENAWYYLAVQEATNSHTYTMKKDEIYEKWEKLTQNPVWGD